MNNSSSKECLDRFQILFIFSTNLNHWKRDKEFHMPVQQLEPQAAKEAMDATENAIYVDVRTENEFAQGHPEGAINIPVAQQGLEAWRPIQISWRSWVLC